MLDRKYKPKTKKRKLHKRTRKHVKQFGGAQKPLNNPRKPLISELHKKFKQRMLNPKKISIVEQMAFDNLAKKKPQQLNVHGRNNNPKSVTNLIKRFDKRFDKSSQKNNPRFLSNEIFYKSPKSFYDVTNSTSIRGSTHDTYGTHGPHNKFYSIGNAYGSSASNPYALPNPSAIYESVNQPHPIRNQNPIYEQQPIYNNPKYENHIYENPNNL
jgi:hypothetical protein